MPTFKFGSLLISLLALFLVSTHAFQEEFDEGWKERWISSSDEKYKGRFVLDTLPPNQALKIPTKALHYGLTAMLDQKFHPEEGVTVQFEAKYASGQTCSGAYLKFYSDSSDFKPENMRGDTPYTIMFGPDVCGSTSKVHLILNHKSPKTGEIEEKHLTSPPRVKTDKKTHVYTATIKPDNTFEMMVDGKVVEEGSLFEKFTPPINPPKEIPDPNDQKPEDWVDEEMMEDPEAVKPDDWEEEAMIDDSEAIKPEGWLDDAALEIADPEAVKPAEWDEDEDGEWVAPMIKNPLCETAPGCGEWKRPQIRNPNYKGPWKPPIIKNPNYKGAWKQATIPNPDFYEDLTPLKSMAPIGSVGFELWVMDENIFFDNIVVTRDAKEAETLREKWTERNELEKATEEAEKEKQRKEEVKDHSGFLRQMLDNAFLHPLLPVLEPLVDFIEQQGQIFYVFVAIMASLILSTLLRRCLRSTKKIDDKVAKQKKEDISEPDDPPKDPPKNEDEPSTSGTRPDEEEDDQKETPKATRSRRSN